MRGALFALLLTVAVPGAAWAVSDPAELLPDQRQEARAEALGRQFRCLVCQNESIEDSDADLARDLRRIIRERIRVGDDDAAIMSWMTARYGDFVRLRPPLRASTIALWGSPVIALGAGAALVVAGRRRQAGPAPLSDEERRRLDEVMRTP